MNIVRVEQNIESAFEILVDLDDKELINLGEFRNAVNSLVGDDDGEQQPVFHLGTEPVQKKFAVIVVEALSVETMRMRIAEHRDMDFSFSAMAGLGRLVTILMASAEDFESLRFCTKA